MRLILLGFGNVGQGFAQILRDKGADLQARYGANLRLVGISTASKGTLYHPDGLDPADLLEALARDGHLRGVTQAGALRDWDSAQLIAHADADVLLETTPSNLNDGQPASGYCAQAIARGWHVVVANKGVVALHHDTLTQQARDKGVHFRYEGTVMAGTPALTLAQEALSGCNIRAVRGILNGTTNYMLTQMGDNGKSYQEAFDEAQALGYLEADPTLDVGGWDAAGKALILARAVFGVSLSMSDLDVSGITDVTLADVQEARANGQTIKLIVEVTPTGGSVRATRLPLSDPLAGVKGGTNAITYDTDLLGNVTLIGAGAGRVQTGFALLTDLLAIHRLSAQG